MKSSLKERKEQLERIKSHDFDPPYLTGACHQMALQKRINNLEERLIELEEQLERSRGV